MKPLRQGQPLGYLKATLLKNALDNGNIIFLISAPRHATRLAEWGYLTGELRGIAWVYHITPKGIAYLQSLNESEHTS